MKKIEIFLKSIVQAKNFCDAIKDFNFDIKLISGENTVNAKIIMDVLTLDLSKPVTAVALTESDQDFEEKIKEFTV